ncbi:MAG: hypothetical protein NVSMB25_22690 [Thermoleophilaceae bacterium]
MTVVCALWQVGCGAPTSAMPVDCKQGSGAVLGALARAPGEVRLQGVRISQCFPRRGGAADIQELGGSLVPAADRLAAEARVAPASPAATQLGYLIGALRRAAPREDGVYYELVRRIRGQLAGVDTRARAYKIGERAGERGG